MGVSIGYGGIMQDTSRIGELVAEMKDICTANQWEYEIKDDDWTLPDTAEAKTGKGGFTFIGELYVKGIIMSSGEDGFHLYLTFTRRGELTVFENYALGNFISMPYYTFCKTRTVENHVAMVNLLRYIQKKYMPDMVVEDGSGFWDTGDLKELKSVLTIESTLMDLFNGIAKTPGGMESFLSKFTKKDE
jgi:hypothetical protein